MTIDKWEKTPTCNPLIYWYNNVPMKTRDAGHPNTLSSLNFYMEFHQEIILGANKQLSLSLILGLPQGQIEVGVNDKFKYRGTNTGK